MRAVPAAVLSLAWVTVGLACGAFEVAAPDTAPSDAAVADAASPETGSADAAGSDDGSVSRPRITVKASHALDPGFAVRLPVVPDQLDALAAAAGGLTSLGVFNGSSKAIARFVEADRSAIWFRLDEPLAAGAERTFWLAPTSGAALADPQRVFALYDTFDGTTLSTQWTVSDMGTATVSDGELLLADGGAVRTIGSADSVPLDAVLDVTVQPPATSQQLWFGFQRVSDFERSLPWIIWRSDTRSGEVSSNMVPEVVVAKCQDPFNPSCSGAPTIGDGKPHVFRIVRTGRSATFYRDGVGSFEHLETLDDYGVLLHNGDSNQLRVKEVRAYPFVDPPPTVTLELP